MLILSVATQCLLASTISQRCRVSGGVLAGLPQAAPKGQLPDNLRDRLREAYAVRLAYGLLSISSRPFSRVIETVDSTHGSHKRDISVEWELPTLADALPGSSRELTSAALEECSSAIDYLTVPLMPMRKGSLLSKFQVHNADGSVVHICGRREARFNTRRLLTFIWDDFEDSIVRNERFTTEAAAILNNCGKQFVRTAEQSSLDAEKALRDIAQKVAGLELRYRNVDGPRRVLSLGRFFARRYLFWVRLAAHPGDYLRLEYSYRTRYDTGYDPPKAANALGLLSFVKRFIGQEPSHYLIPISRHGLASSYHFEMQVPEDCYIKHQCFVLEQDKKRSLKDQLANFRNYANKVGAIVEGDDEAGGTFAHLYAYNLSSEVRNQVFASIQIEERPPGTTSVVFWLALFATLASLLLYGLWPEVTQVDLQGIDLAALVVALPGLASIWFARAFQTEGRFRVPVVSRFGITAIGLSAAYLVLDVVLRRGLCSGHQANGSRGPSCSGFVNDISSRGVLLAVFLGLLTLTALLLVTRIAMHRRYRKRQGKVLAKYGR
jgi:hypothetical protein